MGVVGAGGAGGYFAHRWAEAGIDVTVLARGAHLDAMQRRGLTVLSPLGDGTVSVRATGDPADLSSADVVVFATKTWQLPPALAVVQPFLGPEAAVMGLQNGVASVEVLSQAVHPDRVLGGTCRIVSYVDGPGVVRHVGVHPTMALGEHGGGISTRAREIAQLLQVDGKVQVTASDDITRDLWQKFLFFSAVSGMSSIRRGTIGELRSDPEARSLLRSAIHEAGAVGRTLGVNLDREAEDRALSFVDAVPTDGTSSMQRDFEEGRPTELEALSGYLSRRGKELQVATPTHDFIYATLLPLEREARKRAGA